MNNRKYHTSPDILLKQGIEILNSSAETKFLCRVFAVNMVLSGCKASYIGAMANISRVTVSNWVKTVDECGFEALKTGRHTGRPCKLSASQCSEIDAALQSDPQKLGLNVWDGPSLTSYIFGKYHIKMSVRQCQRLMHKLNFSLIRPQSFPSKENENTDGRIDFKKREKLNNDDTLIPVYEDEVHFQIQTTIASAWFKKGSAPKVKSFPGRAKISYAGFVQPKTGALFTCKPERFNYQTSIDAIRSFLTKNPVPDGKKYAIILDNAPWHKKVCRLISENKDNEYADIQQSVVFIKLPPYSPDLNPIEQVWRITRRENTHNRFFKTINDLETTVDRAFSFWRKPNERLQKLCDFK